MGKKSNKPAIPIVLRAKLHDVLKANAAEPGRPLFVGKPGQEVSVTVANHGKVATLHSSLARINEEADPIGFLISAANGALFPVSYVVHNDDTGEDEIVTEYQSFNLEQRERIHRFLANKIVPTISVSRVIPDRSPEEHDARDPAETSFLNMVRNAAGKAKQLPRYREEDQIKPIIDVEDKEFAEIIGEEN